MNNLKYYREKIDAIDKNIVKLLLLRFYLAVKIVKYKKINKIKITDKKREQQVINNIKKFSKNSHQEFIIKIFKNIIQYSKMMQSKK